MCSAKSRRATPSGPTESALGYGFPARCPAYRTKIQAAPDHRYLHKGMLLDRSRYIDRRSASNSSFDQNIGGSWVAGANRRG